jgi:bromodomain-containing factor 1
MDDIDNTPVTEMVNGHHGDGEYKAEDMFSGPAVESPEPTNEPTPPPTIQAVNPPAAVTVATPPVPTPASQSLAPLHPPNTSTPTDLPDTVMKDATSPFPPSKPFHEPPTYDEPPAKRLKMEASTPTYDQTKKIAPNQQKFLAALLRQVKKAKDASAFLTPVDPIKLNIPRYFEVVSRPMDISTIEKKLNGGQYPVVQALVDDFNLMIENTVIFNGPDNIVTKMGRNIQATFEKGLKTLPAEQVFLSFVLLMQVPQPKAAPPMTFAPPPKTTLPAPAPVRRASGAFPPIRRESLAADGRPKREIKPPPERDIPMDRPRLHKKHAAELRFCQIVIKELMKKVHEPYSYPFILPVDPVALNIPDYFKIIKHPMDLTTVENKLKEQQYTTGDEFYNDVKLIFKNCYRYNGIDSPVALLAKSLEKVFEKKWLEKPEEPPEKPKRGLSSSPNHEEESSSDEDEIGRIQEQMTAMAKRLSEMQSRKKQRHEKSPKLQGKGGKSKKGQRLSGSGKPKKKEYIPEVTFEQKRELSEKINFLSPSKMQGVLELIKDAMPLDAV